MTISFIGLANKLSHVVLLAGLTAAAADPVAYAQPESPTNKWGIGVSYRVASIPYTGTTDNMGSFVPMLYLEDDWFFLRGTSGGIKALRSDRWELSLMGRLRFMDLPDELSKKKFADDLFMGAQLRYRVSDYQHLDVEVLADSHGRMISNLRWSGQITRERWQMQPFIQVQFKSRQMNSFYYGLDQQSLDQGFEFSTGVHARLQVFKNLYMTGSAGFTYLDKETTRSAFIEDSWTNEITIGFAIGEDPRFREPSSGNTKPPPYIRIAHGLGNYSNVLDILVGDIQRDPFNNQLTSVFYGFPLAESLFGIPVDTYLTAGAAWHWNSEVQGSSQELVLGYKVYYTLPLPWRVRLGFAEGISYISTPTHIEYVNIENKTLEPTNWQNYLDLSLDINLGDVFSDALRRFWFGIGVHHRSAIFGKSQQFGRSNAGSNYNTLYIQADL